uniref:Uncharacterized protein n=1 Tax=Fagus sylvatica TaxID=28930 RepID=A0A2N9G183_FAGSY
MCHSDFPLVGVTYDWRNRRRQFAWAEPGPGGTAMVEVVNQQAPVELARARGVDGGGATKKHCLCSPTRHPGSFRCRYHRSKYIWVGRFGPKSK